MGDNLHEKNRKELKELCNQNNIRTAGVKHEELVRLLRNKLYPSTLQTSPRSMKARGPKVLSPGKDDGDSYKTPVKAAGKGRNLIHSSTLPREDAAASQRKTSGLSRKPFLTKSNTTSSRRPDLRTKTPGGDQDAQENFVRRLCQINAMSPLSRKTAEAPGQLETASQASLPFSLHGESKHGRQKSNGKTEDMSSPRASEGDANGTAVEPSEAGSDASRRVSEIATDAGPDTMSDFSDADEFRSVSSEPISKLTSISKRNSLRTESSKMSLLSAQSGLSFFTAGSWGSDHSRSMENSGRGDIPEVIFPEFPEGSNFLVGDTDALDLSFLHAGAADPEVIVNGKDYERKAHELDIMDSPMARDYVNYNRGSETDITENGIDSNRVAIAGWASDQGESLRDVNMGNSGAAEMSIDAADKQRDPTAIVPAEDAESKEVGRINDEFLPENGHAEPIPEAEEDGPEIHSELPCLESNSPTFDAKDYNVAKKLVFEPEEITESTPLQQAEYDSGEKEVNGNNFQNSEEQGPVRSVPKTIEDKDFALHSLDEPAMNIQHAGTAETVSETPPPTSENTSSDGDHGECNLGHRIVEQDVTNNIDQEGGIASVEEFDAPAIDCEHNDAVTPADGHQQESELADTRVPSEGIDSLETEDQIASKLEIIERHMYQPLMYTGMASDSPENAIHSDSSLANNSSGNTMYAELDRSNSPANEQEGSDVKARDGQAPPTNGIHSDSSLTKNLSGNATPELDRSNSPANEQECSDVKARDGQCASTSTTVLAYNKDEREKENMQVKLSFPLSIILWCSHWCSRNPSPSLRS